MTATISFVSSTQTSITVGGQWYSGTTLAVFVRFYIEDNVNTKYSDMIPVPQAERYDHYRQFTFGSSLGAVLSPNTSYKTYVRFYNTAQTQIGQAIGNYTTEAPYVPPTLPLAPTLNLSTSGRVITISGVAGARTRQIDISVNGTYWTYITVSENSSFSINYTGAYATNYTILATGVNAYGDGGSTTKTIKTGTRPWPTVPTRFRVTAQTTSSIDFAWDSGTETDSFQIQVIKTSTSAIVFNPPLFTATTIRASSLEAGVEYHARVRGVNTVTSSDWVTITNIILGKVRPLRFDWTIKKTKGTTKQITNSRIVGLVSASEITAMQNRINLFRDYKDLGAYTFTPVSVGSVFTRMNYNQLDAAITSMNPPIATFGQQAVGSQSNLIDLLNRLEASLNSIP